MQGKRSPGGALGLQDVDERRPSAQTAASIWAVFIFSRLFDLNQFANKMPSPNVSNQSARGWGLSAAVIPFAVTPCFHQPTAESSGKHHGVIGTHAAVGCIPVLPRRPSSGKLVRERTCPLTPWGPGSSRSVGDPAAVPRGRSLTLRIHTTGRPSVTAAATGRKDEVRRMEVRSGRSTSDKLDLALT